MMVELNFKSSVRPSEEMFYTFFTAKDLVEYFEEGIISYNPEIQRGSKIVIKANKEEIIENVYSKTNVQKIYKAMISNNYFSDMISLNVLNDGISSIVETEDDNGVLAYKINGKIEIADGMHRILAMQKIKESNVKEVTDINLSTMIFQVKITHYPLEKAQQQFHQFSKGLKISSSRSEFFNHTSVSNNIVRTFIKSSELGDRVEVINNTITSNQRKNIVTFATLSNAITMVYKDMTDNQATQIGEYLKEFFNLLIESNEEFTNYEQRKESKLTSLKAKI